MRCPSSCFFDQTPLRGLTSTDESAIARKSGSSSATTRRKRTGRSIMIHSRSSVPFPDEELRLVHAGIDGNIEEADHHLIGGLLAPGDGGVGVGVVGIVVRVIVDRGRLQLRAGLERQRFRQAVGQLPIEIVIDPQQSLEPRWPLFSGYHFK